MTWMTPMRGSPGSPVRTPSFKSPNHCGGGLSRPRCVSQYPLFVPSPARHRARAKRQKATHRLDHGVPQVLDGLVVLDDLGGAGDRGPVGAGRVGEGDVDMLVVLELVKLAGCAVNIGKAVPSVFRRTWSIQSRRKERTVGVGDELEDEAFVRGRGHGARVELAVGGAGDEHAKLGLLDDLAHLLDPGGASRVSAGLLSRAR